MSFCGLECRHVGLVRRGGDGAERTILEDLGARFPSGCVSLVMGEIGSGKTTLLSILASLLRPTQGEVLANGDVVSRWTSSHRDRWRRQVGFLFQDSGLDRGLTILENVMMPLVPRCSSLRELRRQAAHALGVVGLALGAGREVGSLSGGEGQRVALARALAGGPSFLLLDEPTAHQDDGGASLVLGIMAQAAYQGVTVVVTSHDHRLRQGAQALWELRQGRLEEGR